MRRRPGAEHLALTGVIALATVLIAHFGLRNHSMQFDELLARVGGRTISADFPSALWQWNLLERGPERMVSILLAAVDALGLGPVASIRVSRWVLALVTALTAVPAFALARGVGAGRWAAVAGGALAVLTPWAVFGSTYLNSGPGALTAALLLWAMWHAVLHPGWRGDLLVLAAFALAVIARIGHAPLVVAMGVGILVALWRDRPEGEPVSRALLAAPGRIVRGHPLLCACAALALALVAVKGQSGILGSYGKGIGSQPIVADRVWLQARTMLARTAEAFAVLPFIVAVPWLLREAVRPRSREAGAFAVLSLAGFLCLLYVLLSAAIEDRYITPLAVPVAVGFVAAVSLRQVGLAAVAVAGVLTARLVATAGAPADDAPYSYFVSAGAQFLRRAIATRLSTVLPLSGHALTFVLIAAVVLAVVLALALRRWPASRMPVLAALAGTLVVTTVGAAYAAQKWTGQAAYAGARTFAAQTFVDRSTGGRPAAYYVNPEIENEDLRLRLLEVWFNNKDFRGTLARAGEQTVFYCCAPRPVAMPSLDVSRATGEVKVIGKPGERMPPYVVTPTGWLPTNLAARRVAVGEPAMALWKLRPGPARLAFAAVSGTYNDGWGKPGRTIRVRVFPGAAGPADGSGGRACVRAVVTAPPLEPEGATTITARIDEQEPAVAGVRLAAGTATAIDLPLPDAPSAMLKVTASATGTIVDGRPGSVLVSDVRVAPCAEDR